MTITWSINGLSTQVDGRYDVPLSTRDVYEFAFDVGEALSGVAAIVKELPAEAELEAVPPADIEAETIALVTIDAAALGFTTGNAYRLVVYLTYPDGRKRTKTLVLPCVE